MTRECNLSTFSKTLVSFSMRQKARAIEKPGRKEVRRRQIVVRTRKILPDQFSICLSYLSAVRISFGGRKIFIPYVYGLNLVFVDDILQNKTVFFPLYDEHKKYIFFAKYVYCSIFIAKRFFIIAIFCILARIQRIHSSRQPFNDIF